MRAVLLAGLAGAAATYETPGPVRAADYLPAALMEGVDWRVSPTATNDGVENTYTVESRFGSWSARGAAQVATRSREIQALAELESVSKTEVFADAVKRSVVAPLLLVRAASDEPLETLKGVPAGVGRWFRRTAFTVRETYHDVREHAGEEGDERAGEGEDGLQEQVTAAAGRQARASLGISAAERRWYRELGVDPHTDNEVLREAVTSVARVEGLTSLGMKYAGLPDVPAAREIRATLDLVWEQDPTDLRLANRKRLLAAGISKESARAFEDGHLSLTEQVAFLDALERMEGVAGRERLLERALAVEDRQQALELTQMTEMLAELHHGATPLTEILGGTALPVARTRDGGLVAALVAGAVFWTEPVADAARSFAGVHAATEARERRLCVSGRTSPRFAAEVGRLGWTVIAPCDPGELAVASP